MASISMSNPGAANDWTPIQLLAGGALYLDQVRGILIGLDRVSSFHEVKAADGWLVATHVLPGRYVLLGMGGELATLEVSH